MLRIVSRTVGDAASTTSVVPKVRSVANKVVPSGDTPSRNELLCPRDTASVTVRLATSTALSVPALT